MHAAEMSIAEALEPLRQRRNNEVVVSTMGALREWSRMSKHPLDLHYIPSAMGHAPNLGLGLALAHPEREVIVLNGDGCMLMNLGSLVTIAASGVTNLTLIVFDNGQYEVTGGQQTAAVAAQSNFARWAEAAGWPGVWSFSQRQPWCETLSSIWQTPGPRFVHLRVRKETTDYQLPVLPPVYERLAELREALLAQG